MKNRSDEEILKMINRRRCLDEMGGYPWRRRRSLRALFRPLLLASSRARRPYKKTTRATGGDAAGRKYREEPAPPFLVRPDAASSSCSKARKDR